jgi:hypothetical protein
MAKLAFALLCGSVLLAAAGNGREAMGQQRSPDPELLLQPPQAFAEKGHIKVESYVKSKSGQRLYRPVPYHTARVNPRWILPGSVLFVPELYGVPLPGGLFHDGFLLAHEWDVSLPPGRIQMYRGNGPDVLPSDLLADSLRLYLVFEPVERSVWLRYSPFFLTGEEPKPLYQMVAGEIDELIRKVNSEISSVKDRIQYYSERGKGTPYLIFCLGEGPHGKWDKDPLVDFSRTDCMVFCEHILALSIANSYEDFFNKLQKIRYKNGQIDFRTRNHFTLADWLPNNQWLLYDATEEIGRGLTRVMKKRIDRRKMLARAGCTDTTDVPPAEVRSIHFIPAESLPQIASRLEGGEIVSIVTSRPGIFSAHMGIIVRDRFGNLLFRHASSAKNRRKVVDEFFADVVARLQKSRDRVGMVFMRVKETVEHP